MCGLLHDSKASTLNPRASALCERSGGEPQNLDKWPEGGGGEKYNHGGLLHDCTRIFVYAGKAVTELLGVNKGGLGSWQQWSAA